MLKERLTLKVQIIKLHLLVWIIAIFDLKSSRKLVLYVCRICGRICLRCYKLQRISIIFALVHNQQQSRRLQLRKWIVQSFESVKFNSRKRFPASSKWKFWKREQSSPCNNLLYLAFGHNPFALDYYCSFFLQLTLRVLSILQCLRVQMYGHKPDGIVWNKRWINLKRQLEAIISLI